MGIFLGFIAFIVALTKRENYVQINAINTVPEKEEVIYRSSSVVRNNDYMSDVERRLKDLKELLEKGYITETEFEEKRNEILEKF